MLHRLIIIIVFTFVSISNIAAQRQLYSQYLFNKTLINPGSTGDKGELNATVVHRSQWQKIENAPKTTTLALEGRINEKVSVGANLVRESIGPYNIYQIDGAYAYRLKFNKATINVGVSAGAYIFSLSDNDLDAFQNGDPAFGHGDRNIQPNFGLGTQVVLKNTVVGFSMPYLTGVFSNINNGTISLNPNNHLYLHAEHIIKVNSFLEVKPATVLKIIKGAPANVDFNVHAILFENYWAGLGYRTDNSWIFSSRVLIPIKSTQFNKTASIGYSFDLGRNNNRIMNTGSTHEINLSIGIWKKTQKLLSPRFL